MHCCRQTVSTAVTLVLEHRLFCYCFLCLHTSLKLLVWKEKEAHAFFYALKRDTRLQGVLYHTVKNYQMGIDVRDLRLRCNAKLHEPTALCVHHLYGGTDV